MTQEILYKGKLKDWNNLEFSDIKTINKWVKGYYQKRYDRFENEEHLIFWAKNYTVWSYEEIDSETLCQMTNFKDKNNENIWEKDIIKDGITKYQVIWDNTEGAWMLETALGVKYKFSNFKVNSLEVIGNMIDTPELLKQKESLNKEEYYHVSRKTANNCKNLTASYGVICVKCGRCKKDAQ